MVKRILEAPKTRSFFLFGARGTGKTTWLRERFRGKAGHWIDLLEAETENRYRRNPEFLDQELADLESAGALPETVVIDEVQKAPKILDIVQKWVRKTRFVLTGSSARKLKRGAGNLLAGRADVLPFFPLTSLEIGKGFDLTQALQYGTLPECHSLGSVKEKEAFLRAYVSTYLREEILEEQVVRRLDPFRNFLEVAAQSSGRLVNFEKFAREVGADWKTARSYFTILEDTLLGTLLFPFHGSVRKSQLQQPKFYYFDPGVQRYLSGFLRQELLPGTGAFGDMFEVFFVNEILRLNAYGALDFRPSFLRTKHGAEIDLILSRGHEHLAVELKSTAKADAGEVAALDALAGDLPGQTRIFYLSRDPISRKVGRVNVWPVERFLVWLSKLD